MAAHADSWKREPFEDGVPVHYVRTFTPKEYARLREGLIPRAMEDKWFVYYDQPYLYFHRSWTGRPCFRLLLPEKDGGAADERRDFGFGR